MAGSKQFKRALSGLIVSFGLLFCGNSHAQINEDSLSSLHAIKEIAAERFGPQAASNVVEWHRLLRRSAQLSDAEKIKQINAFFNLQVYYDDDLRIWQARDYWATPLETVALARGDCEDFTIAKYISLRLLNIPEEKLKLTFVRLATDDVENAPGQSHMVLAYYPDEQREPLILDNLNGRILPESERTDLKPLFSFNDSQLWVAGQPSDINPQQRLSRWRDVLNRMHNEGL